MPSNIVAYEWQLNGTAHIVYQTNDNHIREVIGGTDGSWRDVDITRAAGGPALEDALMVGYDWPEGRTQQIAYVSPMNSNGHIHELVQLQNHPWSYEDLMNQPTGAPPADGLSLAAYSWQTSGTKHVIYTALNDRIHELSVGLTGTWKHADLMQETGAPPAEGDQLSAFSWKAGRSQHIVYLSGDGHIHELMMVAGGSWHYIDLTAATGAPPSAGSALVGYGWDKGGTKQIAYMGDNGDIYEISARLDNVWTYTNLMSQTGAPVADGTALAGYAWETGNTRQVVYVAENHRIYELHIDEGGRWAYTDLMQLTHAPGASNTIIVGHEWTSQFAKQVIYLDMRENPHLHSLLLKHGGEWRHTDLTDLTGAQALV